MIDPLLPALLGGPKIVLVRIDENFLGNLIPSVFILFLTKIIRCVLNRFY